MSTDPQVRKATLVAGSAAETKARLGAQAKQTIALIHDTMPNLYPELSRTVAGRTVHCLPLRLTPAVPWEASLGNMLKREFTDDVQQVLTPDVAAAIVVDMLARASRPVRVTKDAFARAVGQSFRGPYRTVELYDGQRGAGRGRVQVPMGESRFRPRPENAPVDMSDEQPVAWCDEAPAEGHASDDYNEGRWLDG